MRLIIDIDAITNPAAVLTYIASKLPENMSDPIVWEGKTVTIREESKGALESTGRVLGYWTVTEASPDLLGMDTDPYSDHKYCAICRECITCNLRPCRDGGAHAV